MKIKNVQRSGKILEYTPEEKVSVMLKDAISSAAPEMEVHWPENIKVTSLNVDNNGTTPEGYSNNVYTARGDFSLRVHKSIPDKLYKAVPKTFSILFKDIKDRNNMPDMEIIKFESEEVQ